MLETTKLITTESFRLAIYVKGSVEADKLALVLPGKLDTKDYPHMRSHVDFLSARGYLALSFDPPGTWESSGDIKLYTMTNYFKAINEIIKYYDNRPTLLVGHSRGGSMAMLAGTENQYIDRFVSIMASAALDASAKEYDLNLDWKNRGYKVSLRDTPSGYRERTKTFKLPYSFFEDQVQYNMLDSLRKCKKPKLFIAGSRDILIKREVVQNIYNISSEPKYFYLLDSGHDYRKNQSSINKVNRVIDKFITN